LKINVKTRRKDGTTVAKRDALVKELREWEGSTRTFHEGSNLGQYVRQVEEQLPGGPVVLLGGSDEALAVVAAVAATRKTPTVWERLDLGSAAPTSNGHGQVVVVEIGQATAAWSSVVEAKLPEAKVVLVGASD
jgi:hypothetical protein